MITVYKCEFCGAEFKNSRECRTHESNHFNEIDKIKYDLMHSYWRYICNYCDHSYYVYGCEQDCNHKNCGYNNNYKDFVPTEPLHDKSISGV